MPAVSVRVADEVEAKMEAHDEINWSAVPRRHIEEGIADLEERNVAHAVATSERLIQQIDEADVAGTTTTDVIRDVRDTRYGGESD